jgi:hypothetical protein
VYRHTINSVSVCFCIYDHVSTTLAVALHTKRLISLLLLPRPHLRFASHHRTLLMRHMIQCHVRGTEKENLGSVSVDVGVLTGLLR